MAGTAKFDLSSVSPEDSSFSGSYSNGKANYLGHNLDRSGSFREGSKGRSFSSATGNSKANATGASDLPPVSQFINLEQVTLGDQKYTRAGELRRALGFTFGNVSEDNSFGAAHAKPPLTLATDDLKRFKTNVWEGYSKARKLVKRWDESLNNLSKYSDALNSKKQQTNERSGGSNAIKMGTQSHRSSPDLATQKLEERNKSIVLNKRARTAIGEMRAEGRGNGVLRQHSAVGKDKEAGKEGNTDLAEENMRRLPAGGEGWDKKMKRKRSVSTVIHRQVDADGEVKRTTMHSRLGNDSLVQGSDSHSFRSGLSNGASGLNKLDEVTPSVSMAARMLPKNESEKASLSRELTGINKERLLQKGSAKLNMREDSQLFSPSSVTKGKASRAHRTGSSAAGSSSPSFSRLSGTPEDLEQPLNVNKVHSLAGVNNRKRPLPAESSSPRMAQWVQRPQKISRNRRTNIVSPTSNHDEVQMSPEGCASEFGVRTSNGINGSPPIKNMPSSSQPLKVKFENAPSPARLSESEENNVIENLLKDKTLGCSEGDEKGMSAHQRFSPSGLFTKKSKIVAKEEIGDGVRRQGRIGRGASFSRGSMSPMRDKLENPTAGKPVRSSRPGSEKNGSKSGRPPLKKHSDRKCFTRLGNVPSSNSPDFTGESDDDREELLQAAQFACNASYNYCSSSFWKKMEPVFYVRPEDKSFLEEQLKLEHQPSISGRPYMDENVVDNGLNIARSHLQSLVSEESKSCMVDSGLVESTKIGNHINQHEDRDSSFGGKDSKKGFNNLTPLYQRVLSALIVEDEFEEYEDNNFGTNANSMSSRNNPLAVVERVSCNGNATHSRYSGISAPMREEMEEGNYGYSHQFNQIGPGPFQCDMNGSLNILANSSGDSSFERQYGQMCVDEKLLIELQSIGLSPEAVPDLAEGDDESINQDIVQLKKQLSHQAGEKMVHLDKIHKTMGEQKEVEGRELEQLAMNRLTELAYRKLLATRGSSAARMGISKVPRHLALAFIRRTLSRCRLFEDTGKSCFTEPTLRDALFAVPSITSGFNCISTATPNVRDGRTSGSDQSDLQNERFDSYDTPSHQSDHAFAKNGPILNRGKKKEVLLDDVGGNSSMRSSNLGSNLMGGAKGKRSERDSGTKAGRPSISNPKGERKTKAKPKQKAGQMTTHPVQHSASDMGTSSDRKRDGLILPGSILDSSVENKDGMDLGNLPLHELDSIDDLSVGNEFEGHQDLSSWLNFDEVDGLQDHDSMGLEIPMDDLSDLNMLL